MRSNVKYIVLAGLFAALTAVGAFLKIPFYPVPFTLQTFFTALAGLVLLPRWAALSQIVYLLTGLLGLPVFANGGGIGYVLQPTFGYLMLLPVTAYLVAKVMHGKSEISLFRTTVLVSLCSLITVLGGAIWLWLNLHFVMEKNVSFFATLYSGMIIFLPAMMLKAFLASLVWRLWKIRF
jgi:biotin transport system substrate-specific component